MFDLADLEKRLNDDPKLRSEFLADPVGTLEKEGLKIPPSGRKQLIDTIRGIQTKKKPTVGSTIQPAASDAPGISISISKDF